MGNGPKAGWVASTWGVRMKISFGSNILRHVSFSLAAMTCIHPQHGSQSYENNLCSSELDFISRLAVDSPRDHVSAPSLPSIGSLVGTPAGDFDAYSCQFTAAPAQVNPSSGQETPFKLDELQVYGCYPGTFTVSYPDEVLSPGGSDYFGSPTSTSSPSTPGFQSQQASNWDLAFGSFSPSPGYWAAEETSAPHAPSFLHIRIRVCGGLGSTAFKRPGPIHVDPPSPLCTDLPWPVHGASPRSSRWKPIAKVKKPKWKRGLLRCVWRPRLLSALRGSNLWGMQRVFQGNKIWLLRDMSSIRGENLTADVFYLLRLIPFPFTANSAKKFQICLPRHQGLSCGQEETEPDVSSAVSRKCLAVGMVREGEFSTRGLNVE